MDLRQKERSREWQDDDSSRWDATLMLKEMDTTVNVSQHMLSRDLVEEQED